MRKFFTLIFVFSGLLCWGQKGKDGNRTITAANTIVNEYTVLTGNFSAGATSITVTDNSLDSSRFTTPLSSGDLIFIYQAQGATIDGVLSGGIGIPNTPAWGAVLNYNNSGNYEFLEVSSVSGTTTINFTCGLKNAYTSTSHTQVIRVPRIQNLTINAGASITAYAWDGNTGGIVVLETNGTATINGSITVNAKGFRGGLLDPNSEFAPHYATLLDIDGAMKGEGIAGYQADYTPNGGMFCMGAPANAAGGGNAHNAGGGGGANAGDILLWTGTGSPDPNASYVTAWNQESAGFATSSSSGGGRGGYSFSNSNQNAATTPPGNTAWGGDNRKVYGGLGGRPLDYSTGKIFFGGGGGAGDQNDGYGGAGGRGGGIIFMMSYSTISGAGTITANGQNGNSSNNASPPLTGYAGIDGAGGAGGAGAVILNSNGAISGISITGNGGVGGNQNFAAGALASPTYNSAYGPGGGGGGGYIAISNGAITRTTNGGFNGTTNSSGLTEFPPNGATRGGAGTNNASIANYYIDVPIDTITVCSSSSATFTAVVTGTLPGGTGINWYDSQFGSTTVGSGTTFTTPVLASTTTYYVGLCPGHYRIPVTVIVSPVITINTSAINITDETCAGNDGSITGITVSGGTGMLTYEWNGNSSAGPSITGATSGSYTLVVEDAAGCAATAGPFTINTSGGAVINTSSIAITNTSCGNNNGSITGITASDGSGTLTYEWNGIASASLDISNQPSGSYTLTVTDALGCTSTAGPFTINSSSSPQVDITTLTVTDATCGSTNGSITGLTVTGGSGGNIYEWNSVVSTLNQNGLAAGSYTLDVTDNSGCTDSYGPIVINSAGGATIDDSNMTVISTTCGNNNGSITGIIISGGTNPLTIEWNGGVASGADTNSLAAGSYTLEVTDGSGCISSSGPYTINASTNPVLNITSTDASCNSYNDGSADATASSGTAPYTYQWAGGPATSNYPNLSAGTYTCTVTDSAGCIVFSSVTIAEPAPMNTSVSGTDTICNGQSTTLAASGGTVFSWSTTETTAAITVSPISTTTYSVIITSSPCADTISVTVVVNSTPIATITGDTSLCTGEITTLTASGGTNFLWSDGSVTSTISVSPIADSTYSVTVSNNCGSDVGSVNVTVNSPPIADAGVDVSIGIGNSTTLNGSGGVSYSWTPSTDLSCTNCQNPDASPTTTTTYTMTVTDGNGCTASDDVTVTVDGTFVIFIPDAFSPDGNNNNEELFVRGSGIEKLEFRVYDRWGQLVFSADDQQTGWDGTFNNQKLNSAVFVYTLEGNYIGGTPFSQKGNVTLYR